MGVLLQHRGEFTRAEPMFRRLLAMAEKQHPPDSQFLAHLHHNLATIYTVDGRSRMSRHHLERAIALWSEVLPTGDTNALHSKTSFSLLHAQNSLAVILANEGRFTEAENVARKAVTAAASQLGRMDPVTARAAGILGYILARTGRKSEALQMLEHAIRAYDQTSGLDNPILAQCLREYAGVLRKVGRKEEAKRADLRAKALMGQ
jgi:tetratricopeptide (TPR) repeat protein